MLLTLPTELIQWVLRCCSTPTFLQAAFSCRALYEIATSCREVLVHHLRRTPGVLPPDLRSLNSKDLFRLLLRHAFQQLYGAQFQAECVTFDLGKPPLDVKASVLASRGIPMLALVFREQESIHLFKVSGASLRPHAHLELQWCRPGAVEILKTACDGDDTLYILHRFKPSIDDSDEYARNPFVRHAMQLETDGTLYLSRYSLRSPNGPVRICAFPDHADYEPLALAAARGGIFAISWQHTRDTTDSEVTLYISSSESNCDMRQGVIETSYNSCVLHNSKRQWFDGDRGLQGRLARGLFHDHSPVVGLRFNDKSSQLLYYYRAQTLYGSFQRIDMSSFPIQPTLYENTCPVQFTDSLSLLFSIDVPFFGTHETQVLDGFARCQWKYLAFGIATHREEKWTVACLLKSETFCRAQNCQHVLQLERGRRLPDWTVVARLWGFQHSTNSLGCIVAASSQGTRLAVANWKKLYVWALEPGVLIEENGTGFYPLVSQSANSRMIELRPIVLSLEAVCFQLRFAEEENGLIAITDRGVMHWDLSPRGRGQRLVESITC
ncbi:F-box domain protein [Aspergillus homomorphus CBS 101889]|uniref:F-box domain-containing protein n=1 Tax=Aspergillus homomorphus (strain CBS 101889) TaxID=1450537 RepID=A0A395I0A4_ASPHC|nr:F-box domain-containing protein [Aspergillus homomorphus CBS 101889]RAL13622.1 F-box domain-containing protein [Aspergillus homomorphus CBS 101889]